MKSLSLITILILSFSCINKSVEVKEAPNEPAADSSPSGPVLKATSTECLANKNHSTFHRGDGSTSNPFIICTPTQLQAIKDSPSDVFRLGDNLDLSSISNFIPIGGCDGDYGCSNANGSPFTGSFDGDGYEIKNLKIKRVNKPGSVGLFGLVENAAVITNVKVVDGVLDISSNQNIRNVAGVIGLANLNGGTDSPKLVNLSFSGDIDVSTTAGRRVGPVGGVVGVGSQETEAELIIANNINININSDGSVSSIGGVFGAAPYTGADPYVSSNSHKWISTNNNISVVSRTNTGQLGGIAGTGGYLRDSYTRGVSININSGTSTGDIGGTIGQQGSAYTERVFAENISFNITVNSTQWNTGSFMGSNYGTINNSFVIDSQLPSYSGNYSSAFVGYYGSTINASFTDGDVLEQTSQQSAGAIQTSDIVGNDTHPVFSTWDFDTIWEVVPGSTPRLRR